MPALRRSERSGQSAPRPLPSPLPHPCMRGLRTRLLMSEVGALAEARIHASWGVDSVGPDLVEVAVDPVLVAGEEHLHALERVALAGGGSRHHALLAVHDLVAVREGLVWPREEQLLAQHVAAGHDPAA